LRGRAYLRGRTFLRSWAGLLYRVLWLRGWMNLGSRAFLWGWPYRLRRPLLGRGSHWLRWGWLLHRPFLLSPLDGEAGLLARLNRDQSGLMMLYGKRLRSYDRLRLAAVDGHELGTVCTRFNSVLLLNG
jgi:hypothetical protein